MGKKGMEPIASEICESVSELLRAASSKDRPGEVREALQRLEEACDAADVRATLERNRLEKERIPPKIP